MKRRNRKRRMSRPVDETVHASIETTENRCLLAGVVGMELTGGGNLVLTGDAADNQIEIGLNSPDEAYVRGLGGTQIDLEGVVFHVHTFELGLHDFDDYQVPALLGDLDINMGDGDDSVSIVDAEIGGLDYSLSVHGDMDVDLGQGDDSFIYNGGRTFTLGDIEYPSTGVSGTTLIKGGAGSGADHIDVSQFFANDGIKILTGASGNGLDQVTFEEAFVVGEAELRGASGETEISVQQTRMDSLLMKGGSGDDGLFLGTSEVTGNVRIDTGSASNGMPGDYVGVGSTEIDGNLKIDGRQGTTTVQFQPTLMGSSVTVHGNTTINTRGGSDSILIDDLEPAVFMGDTLIKMGGGSDYVDIEASSTFGSDLNVNLGGGADTVEFANGGVFVDGDASLIGGGGNDTAINHDDVIWFSGDPLMNSIENLFS